MEIKLTVNNEKRKVNVKPHTRLIDLLREDLGLTGTKEGCGKGECGACTVLMDNKVVTSCLVLAVQADGSEILTIEGLETKDKLHPIQQAFIDTGAVQCGYCIPGMIISSKKLIDQNLNPSDDQIKRALSGNICRCTGYVKIVDAVKQAAHEIKSGVK
ncbi:MAG: (2Fe-2S)-binding protein [Halanaerobiales bacterium]|nr:(2Fe-2S)-binding protein [Halanaerobiales bacterium]